MDSSSWLGTGVNSPLDPFKQQRHYPPKKLNALDDELRTCILSAAVAYGPLICTQELIRTEDAVYDGVRFYASCEGSTFELIVLTKTYTDEYNERVLLKLKGQYDKDDLSVLFEINKE